MRILYSYEYKGFRLGQLVDANGRKYKVIGFDESNKRDFLALYTGEKSGLGWLCDSVCASVILNGYQKEEKWEWFSVDELDSISIQRDNVLEIQVTRLNDRYSTIEITCQNMKVLERGRFDDSQIGVESCVSPDYSFKSGVFYVKGTDSSKDDKPFIVDNKYIEEIEEKVKLINEKYGIPKRWRAESGDKYFYINQDIDTRVTLDMYSTTDNNLYKIGNYFKTREEAEEKANEIKKLLKGEN